MQSPRDRLRSWLPHLLLISLSLAALWWLLLVIAPIREALIMGGALALLTHPVIYAPFDRLLHHLFPTWPAEYRRYFSSLISTLALTTLLACSLLVVLWALVGNVSGTLRMAVGLAFQDQPQIHALVDLVSQRAGALLLLYPSLGLTQADISTAVEGFFVHSHFGPEFVKFLFTGTGGLMVEIVLTLTTLFYLYSQGAMLGSFMLNHLPLTPRQQLGLRLRFQRTVQHMLADTIGKAVVIGVSLGCIAWAIAGFNLVLVATVGMFVGLMPVVGHAFVWLPLASLLASQGRWTEASCLAIASFAAAWLIEQGSSRMARALGTDDAWLSFLLFLSVIGGALGYGPRGLIIGPAAVITVVLLAEFLGSLYGKDAQAEAAEAELEAKVPGQPSDMQQ